MSLDAKRSARSIVAQEDGTRRRYKGLNEYDVTVGLEKVTTPPPSSPSSSSPSAAKRRPKEAEKSTETDGTIIAKTSGRRSPKSSGGNEALGDMVKTRGGRTRGARTASPNPQPNPSPDFDSKQGGGGGGAAGAPASVDGDVAGASGTSTDMVRTEKTADTGKETARNQPQPVRQGTLGVSRGHMLATSRVDRSSFEKRATQTSDLRLLVIPSTGAPHALANYHPGWRPLDVRAGRVHRTPPQWCLAPSRGKAGAPGHMVRLLIGLHLALPALDVDVQPPKPRSRTCLLFSP